MFNIREKKNSIHILVLNVSHLGKDILFQQESKLVPFSKLYYDGIISVFCSFSIFFNIKKVQHEKGAT